MLQKYKKIINKQLSFVNYFVSLPVETKKQESMSKHKSGKRLTKQRLVEMLQTLFQQNPNETFR